MSEVKCGTCKGAKHLEFERGQRQVPCVTCSGSGINWRKSCEAAQSELAALREELAVAKHEIENRISAEVGAIEALTAAEHRNVALVELLAEVSNDWLTGVCLGSPGTWFRRRDELMTKPTE